MNQQAELFREEEFTFFPAELKALGQDDGLSTYDWCEKYVRLPASNAAHPGRWRGSFVPYAKKVMNLWDRREVRTVVKVWGPQTMKTTTTMLPLARKIKGGYGPALVVMDSEQKLRDKFKDEYIPIFRESPGFRDVPSKAREDTTSSAIRFLGGLGRIVGAWVTSLSKMKSFGFQYVVGDEVEDWPTSSGKGGDPEQLLTVRMRTYKKSRPTRLELISSPGLENGIWSKLLACQVVWIHTARCPICGAEQRMTWPAKDTPWYPRWKFDPDADPDSIEDTHAARYLCAAEGCDAEWTDGMKDKAVRNGRWMSIDKKYLEKEHWDHPFPEPPQVEPLRPSSIGTHLPGWYSPLVSLSSVVCEFLKAKNETDPVKRIEALKTWTNNNPAHPWIQDLPAEVKASALLNLKDDRPEGTAPEWTLAVLLTADVQENGIWYEVRGWGAGRKSAGIRHGFLPRIGALAGEVPLGWEHVSPDFRQLRAVALEDYPEPQGECLAVRFGLVDSGYRTDEVYEFCRLLSGRLAPSKGTPGKRSPVTYHKIDTYPGTGKLVPGGLQLVSYDDDIWKDRLSGYVAPPGGAVPTWILHADTQEDYGAHFEAETRNPQTGEWTLRGRRPNHLWDCGVLQCLAQDILEKNGTMARLEAAAHPVPLPSAPIPPPARTRERIRPW